MHELQVIVNQLRAEKIDLLEPFQVGAIISKLPPTWRGYRKKILHDSKEFSLEEIQKHLRIEEESRVRDKNENSYDGISKANVVNKPIQTNKGNKFKGKFPGPKKDQGKFKKSKMGGCFVCGNLGTMQKIADLRKHQSKR